jgi:two-component system chemotaxis sensor kinase CheA
MVADEFQEILDEYFSSTRELAESAEAILLEMAGGGSPPPERLQEIRRTFHTLKGNSAMMGFPVVADLAHAMEDVLKGVGGESAAVDEELVALLLSGVGLAAEMARAGTVPETAPPSWAHVLADLRRAASEPPVPKAAKTAPAVDEELGRRTLGARAKFVRVPGKSLDAMLDLAGDVHVLLAGVKEGVRALANGAGEASAVAEEFERLESSWRLLEREVFAARLVPIGGVLTRFRRLVRDLAAQQKKEIELVLQGEETTVDKAVVDELGEPLLHLVRNAVDHGIEAPEERAAKGKRRQARITLAARQVSDLVEISIVDDGRGIDVARIRDKAEEIGIATDDLDDTGLLSLLFLPTFSTRDEVTDLSGRGVGLDVVKASLESFGGSVAVQTILGRGTEFRLRFPLTLAVGHGLLLEVDGETFAMPMGAVVETVRLDAGGPRDAAKDGVLAWRGETLPAVDAGTLLETRRSGEPPRRRFAVVLSGSGRKKALLVDRPLGHQDLVVKSLDEALGRPLALSGATLLPGGRIVMIVDARHILESHAGELAQAGGHAS